MYLKKKGCNGRKEMKDRFTVEGGQQVRFYTTTQMKLQTLCCAKEAKHNILRFHLQEIEE